MKNTKIFLTQGASPGETKMSAYCNALREAGLVNMNLIELSSILPHNSDIVQEKPHFSYQDYGKKTYVIMSKKIVSASGERACAGIGFRKEKAGSGHGFVVQIQGNNREKLKKSIEKTLKKAPRNREVEYKEEMHIHINEIECNNKPVCALVALVFDKVAGWNND